MTDTPARWNPYAVQRRRKGQRVTDLHDPALRSRCIAVASTGASRRTVASQVGKPESTIRGWIERGLAYPDVEPYGSFARDYELAERGLDASAARSVAMRVQLLEEMLRKRLDWDNRGPPPPKPTKPKPPKKLDDEAAQLAADVLFELELKAWEERHTEWGEAMKAWHTPPPEPTVQDMVWLERVRISRFPEDYGTSKHRKPEPEYSGSNWLDANSMDREQLGAVFADPPESIRLALQDRAPEVYRILIEGGFDPAAPVNRKASEDDDGSGIENMAEDGERAGLQDADSAGGEGAD